MTVKAATARDLSANREMAQEAIEDGLLANLANVLASFGLSDQAASGYAECIVERLGEVAIETLFALHENDADLRAATEAA